MSMQLKGMSPLKKLAEVKLRLEINRKEVDEVARHQADSLSSLEKEMDVLGRRHATLMSQKLHVPR